MESVVSSGKSDLLIFLAQIVFQSYPKVLALAIPEGKGLTKYDYSKTRGDTPFSFEVSEEAEGLEDFLKRRLIQISLNSR